MNNANAEVKNPTPGRLTLHQMEISNGRYSKRILGTDDISPAGEYYGWLMFLEETELSAITDDMVVPASSKSTAFANVTFQAGTSIPGLFSGITVTSGKVICFSNVDISDPIG